MYRENMRIQNWYFKGFGGLLVIGYRFFFDVCKESFLLVTENAQVLVRTLDILAPIDWKELVLFLMTYFPDEANLVLKLWVKLALVK